MNHEEFKKRILELQPFWHNIDLGDGLRTKVSASDMKEEQDHPASKWERFKDAVPADLSGARILDVGCAEGFFTVEMLKRNAESVTALDEGRSYIDRMDFVLDVLHEKEIVDRKRVNLLCRSFFDFPYDRPRGTLLFPHWHSGDPVDVRYDFVLFLGVLYHLRYPMLAMDMLSAMTDTVYLESATTRSIGRETDESLAYFPAPDAAGWVASPACLEHMARQAGFTGIRVMPPEDHGRAVWVLTK